MVEFSHIDGDQARMVDIGDKPPVDRRATAEGTIRLRRETVEGIRDESFDKGNVLQTARVAGIQAVKATPEMIPMCHPIPLSGVSVEFTLGDDRVTARTTVSTTARTGVEMEALTGVSTALLTVWDMVKRAEKDDGGQYPTTRIDDVRVIEKVKDD